MTRRFRFLETTVYIDLIMVTRISDTELGAMTTTQPVRIPAMLAWTMVQLWLWFRRWTIVRGWTKKVKGQSSELIRWAVALPGLALLGLAKWNDNAILL